MPESRRPPRDDRGMSSRHENHSRRERSRSRDKPRSRRDDRRTTSRSRSPRRDGARERIRDRSPPRGPRTTARERDRDNGRDRPRESDRTRDRDRDRERNKDRDKDRRDGRDGRDTRSAQPKPKQDSAAKANPRANGVNGDMDIDEDDMDAAMRKLMGFENFRSTKNTKVPGNDKLYGVRKEKKTEYRQYMNRSGGFNRPLSPG